MSSLANPAGPGSGPEPAPRAGAPGVPGLTPPSGRFEPTTFLSDVILALGMADPERVDAALQSARNPGQTLEGVLVESGVLAEEELALALSERHGVDHLDLDVFGCSPEAGELIDPALARRYEAVPVRMLDDRTVMVAMADPSDSLAARHIRHLTGLEVVVAVAPRSAVRACIDAAKASSSSRASVGDASSATRPARTATSAARPPAPSVAPQPRPPAPARPASTSPPASEETGDLRRWMLELWLSEREARLEHERVQLQRERAALGHASTVGSPREPTA